MFALALSNVELFVVYVFYAVYSLSSLFTRVVGFGAGWAGCRAPGVEFRDGV